MLGWKRRNKWFYAQNSFTLICRDIFQLYFLLFYVNYMQCMHMCLWFVNECCSWLICCLGNEFKELDAFIMANTYTTDGKSVCAICGYTNIKNQNVFTHIENKHVETSLKEVTCTICSYVCPSRSAFRMHLKKKH